VVWHLECQEGRNFTVGVYPGVCERWNATAQKWQQAATGFFAEIRERITPQSDVSVSTMRAFDRGSEMLYATRDEAYTLALRRIRVIARDEANDEANN